MQWANNDFICKCDCTNCVNSIIVKNLIFPSDEGSVLKHLCSRISNIIDLIESNKVRIHVIRVNLNNSNFIAEGIENWTESSWVAWCPSKIIRPINKVCRVKNLEHKEITLAKHMTKLILVIHELQEKVLRVPSK